MSRLLNALVYLAAAALVAWCIELANAPTTDELCRSPRPDRATGMTWEQVQAIADSDTCVMTNRGKQR